MDHIDINIVIAPPELICKKARRFSKQLRKQGTLFTLGLKDFIPHISIYMCRIPLKNLDKVQKSLSDISSLIRAFPITAYRFRNVKGGYIDIRYYRNIHMRRLQFLILQQINPLRDSLIRDKDKEKFPTYSLRKQRAIEKYGYTHINNYYFPHLTLTKLATQLTFPEMDVPLKWEDMSFTVNKLAIYITGEHGTCRKLIKSFKLEQ